MIDPYHPYAFAYEALMRVAPPGSGAWARVLRVNGMADIPVASHSECRAMAGLVRQARDIAAQLGDVQLVTNLQAMVEEFTWACLDS